jgi:hypothetical protein
MHWASPGKLFDLSPDALVAASSAAGPCRPPAPLRALPRPPPARPHGPMRPRAARRAPPRPLARAVMPPRGERGSLVGALAARVAQGDGARDGRRQEPGAPDGGVDGAAAADGA